MEQHRNESAGETGDPRENPPTSGIVRHDSYLRKSGVNRPGIGPGFVLVGGEQSNRSATVAPLKLRMSDQIWAALNIEVWRSGEGQYGVASERKSGKKREITEKTLPASGIVRHDSHMRKSGSDPTGNRTRSALLGGE
ncbi:hypothetical protein PR048_027096 [Dryococelus australis]|uniref:Uncharacterized protein n=1 Tax=Dryococelus australis TaxID=614101 RepID=A0ABQ9GF01_9NEOP|nr:hypothetical protein PR048_027096 [Dryococelus australis]